MIKTRFNPVLFLLVGALHANSAAAAPVLQYSQDGENYTPFSMIEGNKTANQYYAYRKASGHPDFGLARATASVGVYWDDAHDRMSLIVITGSKGSSTKRDRGKITFNFSGLPNSAYPMLSDDSGEFKYRKHRAKAQAKFSYKNHSDGLVIGGLEPKTWIIKISTSGRTNISAMRLVDGDVNDDGEFVDMLLSKPLWIKWGQVSGEPEPPVVPPVTGGSGGTPTPPGGTPTTPPSVPEPGAGVLMIAGVLLARRRR